MAGEVVSWMIFGTFTSLVLGLMLWSRRLLLPLKFKRPTSIWEGCRYLILGAMLAIFALSILLGIPDGDVGMVFSGAPSVLILAIVLMARR